MTKTAIDATLSNLRHAVARNKRGSNKELRVRIGCTLAYLIELHHSGLIKNYRDPFKHSEIYGLPVDIDFNNIMCLEVASVEKVLVTREGGADDGN